MARLCDICSDADALLELEPEELAGVVLEHLHSLGPDERGKLNRGNYANIDTVQGFEEKYWTELPKALMVAWMWLEREGLLAPDPKQGGDWVFITRRGTQLKNADDFTRYRRASMLPPGMLHGRIAVKVSATFLRGDYDTAVFQAFKEVEVAVREAAGLAASDLGVTLMRHAFHPNDGPLTDNAALQSEKQALSDLFAGAVGSYKNPHSHRNVEIEPGEAVEMIVLASHLLGIVERRAATAEDD